MTGRGRAREQEAMQNEDEAVQIEAQEAMQIEAQARVNQDPIPPHDSPRRSDLGSALSPATAWPRRVRGGRPPRAQPSTGNSGQTYGRFLALGCNPSRYTGKGSPGPSQGYPKSWWCRLGRKDLIFESGVRGREPPAGR